MCLKDCSDIENADGDVGPTVDSCDCTKGLIWDSGSSSCKKDCREVANAEGDSGPATDSCNCA